MSEISANFVQVLNDNLGIFYSIILNAFGVVAILLKVIEYQCRSRKAMFTVVMLVSTCWVCYFVFAGNFVSALVCFIAIAQFLVFKNKGKHAWADSRLWLILFLALQLTAGIVTFINWYDIFALSAGVLSVFTYYIVERKKYRTLSLFYMLCWVTNSICNGYLLPLLNDSFACVSVIVAIIRFDLLNKKEKNLDDSGVIADKTIE